MELLILRHAIAHLRDAKRWPDDRVRPLTMEGVKRARRAAAGLKSVVAPPALVLTSPLVRARHTAEIFSQAARWPNALDCEALSPAESPERLLEVLRRRAAKAKCIAVVGHQPLLGKLVAFCLEGEPRPEAFELKRSAVICLRFEGPPRAGHGVLAWSLPPRILRRL